MNTVANATLYIGNLCHTPQIKSQSFTSPSSKLEILVIFWPGHPSPSLLSTSYSAGSLFKTSSIKWTFPSPLFPDNHRLPTGDGPGWVLLQGELREQESEGEIILVTSDKSFFVTRVFCDDKEFFVTKLSRCRCRMRWRTRLASRSLEAEILTGAFQWLIRS